MKSKESTTYGLDRAWCNQLEKARKEQRMLARDVEICRNPMTGFNGQPRRKFIIFAVLFWTNIVFSFHLKH